MRPEQDYSDHASVGLVREILQVILGLEPEVEARVMRLIRGSQDAQDIKTPELRMRIGARALKYLTNAIDLARSEGSEHHEDDPDFDLSKEKRGDIEPGHHHEDDPDDDSGRSDIEFGAGVKEGMTFKDFLLNEFETMVDPTDPDAVAQLRRDQRMAQRSPERLAAKEIAQAKDEQKMAQTSDSPTASLETMIARKKQELLTLQKRLAVAKGREQQ